ncbi:MAG: peptide chain release factor 1 [Elainella sp.]
MNNPLRRLRQLPWVPLFLISLLTLFWASVLELLLGFGSVYVPLINRALGMLFMPPLNVIMGLAVAVGLGALAVLFLEIVYPQLLINSGVLWALVLCLFLLVVVRSILPIPTILLEPSYSMLIGSMLGIFLKGKPYWR